MDFEDLFTKKEQKELEKAGLKLGFLNFGLMLFSIILFVSIAIAISIYSIELAPFMATMLLLIVIVLLTEGRFSIEYNRVIERAVMNKLCKVEKK